MRAAAVSVLLLAALCVASAGRVGPDDLFSSVKDAWNNVGTMQVSAGVFGKQHQITIGPRQIILHCTPIAHSNVYLR